MDLVIDATDSMEVRLLLNEACHHLKKPWIYGGTLASSCLLYTSEISKDDYDRWRYYYPKYDTTQLWAKVPSQELSDTLVEAFQDKLKKDE